MPPTFLHIPHCCLDRTLYHSIPESVKNLDVTVEDPWLQVNTDPKIPQMHFSPSQGAHPQCFSGSVEYSHALELASSSMQGKSFSSLRNFMTEKTEERGETIRADISRQKQYQFTVWTHMSGDCGAFCESLQESAQQPYTDRGSGVPP